MGKEIRVEKCVEKGKRAKCLASTTMTGQYLKQVVCISVNNYANICVVCSYGNKIDLTCLLFDIAMINENGRPQMAENKAIKKRQYRR